MADISTTRFQTASGCGPGQADFLEIVNDAVQELIVRGDWSDTLIPMAFSVSNGCLTLPRFVGEVRKIHSFQHGTIELRNQWYQFLERRVHQGWEGCRGVERNLEMQYRSPLFQDICGTGNYLQFYPTVPQDVGAQMTIFGKDDNGNWLQTQNGDGTWSPGITLTATMPFTQSTVFVNWIERIACTQTQSKKLLYAFNSGTGNTYQLAGFEPTETNPSYLRYKLSGGWNGPWSGGNCCGGCPQSVVALIKLANLPIVNPQDLVIINNRGALLDAIRAIKAEDSTNSAAAAGFWKSAIEKLNRQLENDFPEDQTAVANNTWGDSTIFSNQAF